MLNGLCIVNTVAHSGFARDYKMAYPILYSSLHSQSRANLDTASMPLEREGCSVSLTLLSNIRISLIHTESECMALHFAHSLTQPLTTRNALALAHQWGCGLVTGATVMWGKCAGHVAKEHKRKDAFYGNSTWHTWHDRRVSQCHVPQLRFRLHRGGGKWAAPKEQWTCQYFRWTAT